MTISKQEARRRAEQNWLQWRLVIGGVIRYSELDLLDYDSLLEANAALDIHIEQENAASKKSKK